MQRSPLVCAGDRSLESQDGVRTPGCQSSALPQGTSGKGMAGEIQAICPHTGTASSPSPPQSLPHHCPLLRGASLNGAGGACEDPSRLGGRTQPWDF